MRFCVVPVRSRQKLIGKNLLSPLYALLLLCVRVGALKSTSASVFRPTPGPRFGPGYAILVHLCVIVAPLAVTSSFRRRRELIPDVLAVRLRGRNRYQRVCVDQSLRQSGTRPWASQL